MLDVGIVYGWLHEYREDINAFATTILAMFTVVLAIATVFLWKSSEKHALHMEGSVKVARLAANAAQRSADIAEKSLTALNRPLIMISQFEKIFPIVSDEQVAPGKHQIMNIQWDLQYRIMNYGKSLAIIHEIEYWTRLYDELPFVLPQFYADRIRHVCLRAVKVPKFALASTFENGPYKSTVEMVHQPRCENIVSGIEKYFFFGFIRYTDIFVGKTYLTGQALRYDYGRKTWATVDTAAYNYDATQEDIEKFFSLRG